MAQLCFAETLVGDQTTLQLDIEVPTSKALQLNTRHLLAHVARGCLIIENKKYLVVSGTLNLFPELSENRGPGMIYELQLNHEDQKFIFYAEKDFNQLQSRLRKILNFWTVTTTIRGHLIKAADNKVVWKGQACIKPSAFLKQLFSFRCYGQSGLRAACNFLLWFGYKSIQFIIA